MQLSFLKNSENLTVNQTQDQKYPIKNYYILFLIIKKTPSCFVYDKS